MENNTWCTEEFDKQLKEELYKLMTSVIWGDNKSTDSEEDNLKWAYVNIDNQRVMLFVNNKTMKAYKTEGYEVIKPLEEVKYTSFERWCTSFDL